ncbi:DUF6705 family protein [Chryseobacterium sp.]|uniref:DUF6705 family protein n=1 Tax=Chryseobacterium sp. TaxID=1871047 RepID=UPI00333E956F
MKNILNIICLIIAVSLMGQQLPLPNTTVSLETMAQCDLSSGNCPNAAYVKDINNSLNKYIGTWKGTLNGKSYEFNFVKKEKVGETRKWDRLIGRLKITNSNGIIEFNNFNKTDIELEKEFGGFNFQKDLKAYMINFFGGKLGCIDYGYAYLRIKPETPNQMGINFHPDYDIVTQDCSGFLTTLPTNQIIHLTRQ